MAKASTKQPKFRVKAPAVKADDAPRRLKKPTYSSFRLQKHIKSDKRKLTGAFRLLWRSVAILRPYWLPLLGMVAIYAALNILLAEGLNKTSSSVTGATSSMSGASGTSQLAGGLTIFTYMLGGSDGSGSPAASVYRLVLILIMTLAFFWALRQIYAGHKFRIRDPFYRGMYPLVPFVLVLVAIAAQLLPLVVSAGLIKVILTNGIAVNAAEYILWGALCLLLAIASLYMVCSSLFALCIVSLPEMTPMRALRSARELVRYRRWSVLRKLLFLPLALLVLSAIILLPLILFVQPIAGWSAFILGMLLLPVGLSYLYAFYRDLL